MNFVVLTFQFRLISLILTGDEKMPKCEVIVTLYIQ